MSLLTDVLHGRMSFHDAAAQVEKDAENLVNHLPAPLHDAIIAMVPALKQSASNAVDIGDTAMKAALDVALAVVSPAVTAAMAHYVPQGTALSPLAVDALDRIASALKAEIDALAFQAKADLAPTPPAPPAH